SQLRSGIAPLTTIAPHNITSQPPLAGFQNQVFLENAEPAISTLKIQSVGHQPADTFLERETRLPHCPVSPSSVRNWVASANRASSFLKRISGPGCLLSGACQGLVDGKEFLLRPAALHSSAPVNLWNLQRLADLGKYGSLGPLLFSR